MNTRRSFFKSLLVGLVSAPLIVRAAMAPALAEASSKIVPYWYQTTRMWHCVDSTYMAHYEALMKANPAFHKFGTA